MKDKTASSSEEDHWMPQWIHLIKQSMNAMTTNRGDGDEFFTVTLLVNYVRQRITSMPNTTTQLQQHNPTTAAKTGIKRE